MGTWWVVTIRHSQLIQIPHLDFRGCCVEKLEKLGDAARDSQKHSEAIGYYSTALSLDPMKFNDILLKRSLEVWIVFQVASNGTWVIHIIQVIKVDPSSHEGYEGKHAALHNMRRHGEAFEAFRMMLSKLAQSSDPKIRGKPSCQHRRLQGVLIGCGQSFVINMLMPLPRFKRW